MRYDIENKREFNLLSMLNRGLTCLTRALFPILMIGSMALFVPGSPRAAPAAAAVTDLRVLIDVSGSMKRNDPKNLRGPALRLLTELIPEGNRAGVWTFGRYVNPQVRHGVVNKIWKARALSESKNIHSRGLYTNIENALKIAGRGWEKPDPAVKRHMILLTDGMVDISENDAEDAASRKRVMEEILPRLKKLNVAVHTLALSGEVDQELMRAFALATDGVAKQVDSAEQLHRAFLHLFEQSTHAETLPLNENRFSVDTHIQDMTVLVFSSPDGRPTRLRAPDGSEFSAKQHPKSVRWHHEQSYDLITVHKPARGEWTILSELDPDNRVMVVTNLGMFTDPLPNNLTLGEALTISTQLHEKGSVIIARDFLDLVSFTARLVPGQGEPRDYPMHDGGENGDAAPGDGTFTAQVADISAPGDYEILITASSESFQREFRHHLQVYDQPFQARARMEAAGIALEVVVNTQIVKANTVSIVRLGEDGATPAANLLYAQDTVWREVIPIENAPAKVQLQLTAGTVDGVLLRESLEVELPLPAGAATEAAGKDAGEDGAEAAQTDADKASAKDQAPDAADAKAFDWSRVMIYLIAGNVILFGGGIGGWLFWKRRRSNADEQALDDFDESVSELPVVEAPPAEAPVDGLTDAADEVPVVELAPLEANETEVEAPLDDPSAERKPHPNMSVDIADEEQDVTELPPLDNDAQKGEAGSDIFGEDVSDDIAGDLADLLGGGDDEAVRANVATAAAMDDARTNESAGDDDLPVLDDVVTAEPAPEETAPGDSKQGALPGVDESN